VPAVAQPIITPEAVVLDFDRAGVASRTLAMIVDALALFFTWLAVVLAVMLTFGLDGGGAAVFYVLFSLLLVLAWFWGFETLMRGRTPGKAALGLRVVGTDGTPIRFQQAFLRSAVGFVDFLVLPVGCIAVLTVLMSPRDQRLGDMAAGTLVVRERSARSYVAPAWFSPPHGYERYTSTLDVGALDAESYEVVRSFLLRSHELTPSARDHMAVRLANPIAVRMRHTPAQFLHPQAFLLCVAAAWQQAHGLRPPDVWRARPAPPPPIQPLPPQPGPPGPPGYPPPPADPPPPPPPPASGPQDAPWR
jgi:uncharacterized RDD family membrane protein YckC